MIRIAVIADYLEENWPSMDLVAEQTVAGWKAQVAVELIRPIMRRRFSWLGHYGWQADRLLGRQWDYPRLLSRLHADVVHVVDHSYAAVVPRSPARVTGVVCHDVDAFRSLWGKEERPSWYRRMSQNIWQGMLAADVVFYTTEVVGEELREQGLQNLVKVPLGVHPDLRRTEEWSPGVLRLSSPYLLNVGSAIPRKRLDRLIDAFSVMKHQQPELQLVQVGATWTNALWARANELQVAQDIVVTGRVSTQALACLYSHAACVVMASDREGYGLPIIEALHCGAPVASTPLPSVKEIGGEFVALADDFSADSLASAIREQCSGSDRQADRIAFAQRYSWAAHAEAVLTAYRERADR